MEHEELDTYIIGTYRKFKQELDSIFIKNKTDLKFYYKDFATQVTKDFFLKITSSIPIFKSTLIQTSEEALEKLEQDSGIKLSFNYKELYCYSISMFYLKSVLTSPLTLSFIVNKKTKSSNSDEHNKKYYQKLANLEIINALQNYKTLATLILDIASEDLDLDNEEHFLKI